GEIMLHAPELIRYEVGNVLVRRVGNPGKCFGEFLALPLRIHALSNAQHQRALALQIDRRIFYYDAAYLALAESLDLPLLTDDRKLVKASHGRALALVDFPTAPEKKGAA
ncbi:MAG: type II toxin-antitoxin system VapC family toxin, partial [bacterium]